ncbi:MAG: ABC transporter permease [Candidatus Hydrogenedentota bacterium]
MIGKLIPYCVVGIAEVAFLLTIMRFLFQVPIAGSLLLLAAFSMVFIFTVLGFGLLISTLADNQIQALQYSFVILLPSVLLSGFMFPLENMPYAVYVIGRIVPVTYFIEILRGIILRGAGLAELWTQGLVLVGMGLALLLVSTFRFRKTL